ncbi:MAG: DUF3343 domain-containing protein [Coriobacteriia bacterium]
MSARATRPFVVFGFPSTHEALRGEEALRAASVGVVPVPTPHALGAHCGIAMRVPRDDDTAARTALDLAGVPWSGPLAWEDV